MSADRGPSAELRAKVRLRRNEIAHLWNGGILSLKVEGPGVEADLEISCSEAEPERERESSSSA